MYIHSTALSLLLLASMYLQWSWVYCMPSSTTQSMQWWCIRMHFLVTSFTHAHPHIASHFMQVLVVVTIISLWLTGTVSDEEQFSSNTDVVSQVGQWLVDPLLSLWLMLQNQVLLYLAVSKHPHLYMHAVEYIEQLYIHSHDVTIATWMGKIRMYT